MKNTNEKLYTYSRRQRILAWIALVGIFVCGMMAGAFIWQTKTTYTPDSGASNDLVHNDESVPPCRLIENVLLENIKNNINNSSWEADENHEWNADVYEHLVKVGCEENKEKYATLVDTEREIAKNLRLVRHKVVEYNDDTVNDVETRPCEVIEENLLGKITNRCSYSDCHLQNAEIYSKITEDGCPENAEKYKQLALDELQISEGVRIDDSNIANNEIRSTINTYKKLQMQNEAKKYLNKVEKMVNPGIDFILELQRIIEE